MVGNFWVVLKPMPIKDIGMEVRAITREDIRFHQCHIKTLNLLPAVLASSYAEGMGADEAVFYRGDRVTECAHSNISILKDGVLITHPTDTHILPGITRAKMIDICKEMGVKVEERPFSRGDLRRADAVLVTSSSKLCLIADSLDGVPLRVRYRSTADGICERFFDEFIAKTAKK